MARSPFLDARRGDTVLHYPTPGSEPTAGEFLSVSQVDHHGNVVRVNCRLGKGCQGFQADQIKLGGRP